MVFNELIKAKEIPKVTLKTIIAIRFYFVKNKLVDFSNTKPTNL